MRNMEQVRVEHFLEDYFLTGGEFTLFDFGIGLTRVPMWGHDGSLLTKTAIFPLLRGSGEPTYDGPLHIKEGQYIHIGNGWLITVIEINYFDEVEAVKQKLLQAEAFLLDVREGQQAKSAGG